MTEDVAEDGTGSTSAVPFISRVRIKNYKSIASCDVRLGPLTILVGPNGSGKSNFLDALAFMTRALETTPEEAINERGGLGEILRRVPGGADSFTIAVETTRPFWPAWPELPTTYGFEIGPTQNGTGFEVIREDCIAQGERWISRLRLEHGSGVGTLSGVEVSYKAPRGRLALQTFGGEPFESLYYSLRSPRFYNFDTQTLRRPQSSAARPLLQHDGEALGDVLAALATDFPVSKARLDAYVNAIVPDATAVKAQRAGGYMTVSLKTNIEGDDYEFSSLAMSDGTIRAVAMLAALFQPEALDGRLALVGIEEPETALHPAAAGVLFDALTEASERVQVIATSQSPDLLDREDIDPSVVRVVVMRDGLTVIGEVDEVSREIAAQKLYTLGALMRGDQLTPAPSEGGDAEE